jgi:hypothetical protein
MRPYSEVYNVEVAVTLSEIERMDLKGIPSHAL